MVLAGCANPVPKCYYPKLEKAKHVTCEYTFNPDGSLGVLNAQKADKCAQKLWLNQKYYEEIIDNYTTYTADKDQ